MEPIVEEKGRTGTYVGMIALLIVALLIGYFLITYFSGAPNENEEIVGDSSPSATLVLSSDKTSYKVGEEALVQVLLSSDVPTDGADIFIEFDPTLLELKKADPERAAEGENLAAAYLANTATVFGEFPFARLDDRNDKKVFVFSAISNPDSVASRNGSIALLRFETLKAGTAAITILAEKGATNDTNIAYQGKDVLNSVTNITLSIEE